MYTFVNESMIILFFTKFNIDYTLFSAFEKSIIILLSNIFFIIFLIFVINLFYKIACRFARWLF